MFKCIIKTLKLPPRPVEHGSDEKAIPDTPDDRDHTCLIAKKVR